MKTTIKSVPRFLDKQTKKNVVGSISFIKWRQLFFFWYAFQVQTPIHYDFIISIGFGISWHTIHTRDIASLYLAGSSVSRGNLVLIHSVHHFPLNSGGIVCWVAVPYRNINLYKYFISSSGDQTHNQSSLQSLFMACATPRDIYKRL